MPLKRIISFFTSLAGILFFIQAIVVFASGAGTLSQTINDGTKTVDIVDSSGNGLATSGVNFSPVIFSFESQNSTGTLGDNSQRIRVFNPTSTNTWTVSVAATDGTGALWKDTTGHVYDYNDSNTDGADDPEGDQGLEADTAGGHLAVDPSIGTITGVPDDTLCPLDGITKGSASSFREVAPSVSSVTLLIGGSQAAPYCRWDLTGVGLSQLIPPRQIGNGVYTLSFTLSIM